MKLSVWVITDFGGPLMNEPIVVLAVCASRKAANRFLREYPGDLYNPEIDKHEVRE